MDGWTNEQINMKGQTNGTMIQLCMYVSYLKFNLINDNYTKRYKCNTQKIVGWINERKMNEQILMKRHMNGRS